MTLLSVGDSPADRESETMRREGGRKEGKRQREGDWGADAEAKKGEHSLREGPRTPGSPERRR